MVKSTKELEISWENADDDSEAGISSETNEFAALLADESTAPAPSAGRPRVGDQISARISYISSKTSDVLVELGGKITAVIAKQDLLDGEGIFRKEVGDIVSAYVVSIKNGEFFLSTSLAQGMRNENALETAYESQIPVKGKIAAVQKGGFTVMVHGRKAFCPVSQLASRYIANPEEYLDKEFEFLIKSFSTHNIVVSRSQLLQQQAEIALVDLEEAMLAGTPVRGTVEEIKPFGVVLDLGKGLSGLIHVSELGYGFTDAPGEKHQSGDQLTVKVLKIEPLPGKNTARISLSLKALESDPWLTVEDKFRQGESYTGKVIRLTDFGAFVELAPGIDGLIHLSEMAWGKRVHHPRDVVKVGDTVSVRLLELDSVRKRLSLSMKSIEEDPWFEIEKKFIVGASCMATMSSLRSFGAIAELAPGVTGLLPISTLKHAFGDSYRKKAAPPQQLSVIIASVAVKEHKILLTLPNLDAADEEMESFKQYLREKDQSAVIPSAAEITGAQGSFGDLLKRSIDKQK